MRTLTLVVLACAVIAAKAAWADDQSSLAALRAACADDAQKLCAGVQPGGGRILTCLKEQKTLSLIAVRKPPDWLRTQALVLLPHLPAHRPKLRLLMPQPLRPTVTYRASPVPRPVPT